MNNSEFLELCKTGSLQQINDAIKNGANVNATVGNGSEGVTILMRAAFLNDLKAVTNLINAGADVNMSDSKGATVLAFAAVGNSDPEIITALLNGGAKINACQRGTGRTALMAASEFNSNPKTITALLSNGADVNQTDDEGFSALMNAAYFNTNPEIITALVNAGAKVNMKDNAGMTALMYAAWRNRNRDGIVNALLDVGAKANIQSRNGNTALDLYFQNNNDHSYEYGSEYAYDRLSAATKKACYLATCVYGSYDCPEVWTFRRFRDDTLAQSWFGRAFICAYYAISPSIVKLFGNARWFNKLCKPVLDKLVTRLQESGVESSPYSDRFPHQVIPRTRREN